MQRAVMTKEQVKWVRSKVALLKTEGKVDMEGQEVAAHNFVSSLIMIVPKIFPNAQRFRIEGFRSVNLRGDSNRIQTREQVYLYPCLGVKINCVKFDELPAPAAIYRLYHITTDIGEFFLFAGLFRADGAMVLDESIRFHMVLQLDADGALCMETGFVNGCPPGMTFYMTTLVGIQCLHCGAVDHVPDETGKKTRTAKKGMKYCKGCLDVFGRRVTYCTPECQADHWAMHRMSCGVTEDKRKKTEASPDALLRDLVLDNNEATSAFEREVGKEMDALNTRTPYRIFHTHVMVLMDPVGCVTRSLVDEIPWLASASVLSFTKRGDVYLIVLHALYAMNVRLFVRVLRGSHMPVEVCSNHSKSIDLLIRCDAPEGVLVAKRTDLIVTVVVEETCLVCGATASARMAGVRFLSCLKCAVEPVLPPVLYCSKECMAENATHHAFVCRGILVRPPKKSGR